MNQTVSLDRCEREIMAGKGQGLLGAIRIGKSLDIINDGNLWVQVGAKSFEAYVSNTHGFSRSTAYNMMSVARYFGPLLLEDPSLQTVDVTRLIRLLPLVTAENKDDLLRDAALIPDARGFENQIRNRKGKVATDDDHTHEFEPIPYEACVHCGLRRKIKV